MKLRFFGAALMAASMLTSVPVPARAADNQPNIVYIVADDLGWKDVGYHGDDFCLREPFLKNKTLHMVTNF